jgi:hypothetical protein
MPFFQYSWFHIIFVLGTMYVAVLLTDWYVLIIHDTDILLTLISSLRNIVSNQPLPTVLAESDPDVYIGRSEVAMWMRVVSSWICMILYIWTLVAPVLMPDRFVVMECSTG